MPSGQCGPWALGTLLDAVGRSGVSEPWVAAYGHGAESASDEIHESDRDGDRGLRDWLAREEVAREPADRHD